MYNFAAERRDLHALLDQSAKASITNKRKALYFGDLANRLREELEEVKKRAVEKDSGAGVKREVGDVEKEPENQEGEEGDGAKKLN
jgi:23S rRNA maturation mini-RNase III